MYAEFGGRANEHNDVPTFLAAHDPTSGCIAFHIQLTLSFTSIMESEYDLSRGIGAVGGLLGTLESGLV
jgi:hypothetical protein